jgi:hypothetical protein
LAWDVVLLLFVPLEHVEHHRRAAGGRRHLDEAHAAVGRHAEAGVPAVVRDVDAGAVRRADDGVAPVERDFATVDLMILVVLIESSIRVAPWRRQ